MAADNVLSLLLGSSIAEVPETDVKMLRLSAALGEDVIFRIRAVRFDRAMELQSRDDWQLQLVLECLISPDLKSPALLAKYNAVTPLELLRDPRFLLPGEVVDLAREIEKLSGYRKATVKEIRKN